MDHDQPALPPDSPLMTMTNSFLNDGMLLLSMPGHTRDGTYYIHDGNTVLLVEKTLFKVSRLLLLTDWAQCQSQDRTGAVSRHSSRW